MQTKNLCSYLLLAGQPINDLLVVFRSDTNLNKNWTCFCHRYHWLDHGSLYLFLEKANWFAWTVYIKLLSNISISPETCWMSLVLILARRNCYGNSFAIIFPVSNYIFMSPHWSMHHFNQFLKPKKRNTLATRLNGSI